MIKIPYAKCSGIFVLLSATKKEIFLVSLVVVVIQFLSGVLL